MRWWSAFWLLLIASHARAVSTTFDVHVYHICKSADLCEDDDLFAKTFEGVNHRFAPQGISFRLRVDRLYNAQYAQIVDSNSPGVSDLWQIAQAAPHEITFFSAFGWGEMCWSQTPQSVGDDSPLAYQLFCHAQSGSAVFAHELGHYFCLNHTHTFQDPANNSPVNHDGDGLVATPPDPGIREAEGDLVNSNGPDIGPGHEWCDTHDIPNAYSDLFPNWRQDAGGYLQRGCTLQCWQGTSGADQQTATYAPLAENGMSYYNACSGPWTYDGTRHEFFLPVQRTLMQACIANEPERQKLTNVCAGVGDTDGDGLCDDEDACPTRFGMVGMDKDEDGDGIVDGCDTCMGFVGNGVDSDGDGVCDANDVDDDNDTCNDNFDEHPLQGEVVVGHQIGDHPTCTGPIYAWEGTVLPSGQKLCKVSDTHDVDGDGILDANDFCLLQPGIGCITSVSCPLPPVYWRLICAFGGCNELELHIVEASNPGDILARSRFQIVNNVMYAFPAQGQSLLETARTFAGATPPASAGKSVLAKREGRRLRFEIRKGRELVALMAEVDTTRIGLGRLQPGAVLAITTDDRASSVSIETSWGVGIAPGANVQDEDRDGIFDAADNCTAVANPDQIDSDGDNYGNRCDPDLDNDGRVTDSDARIMSSAIGGVAVLPYTQVGVLGADRLTVPRNAVPYRAAADIDGDGQVTSVDQRLWREARLGPSGIGE